jgi:hypothetical protein
MTAEAEIHVEATWNLRGSAIVRRRSEGDAERRPAAVGGERLDASAVGGHNGGHD